MKHIESESCPCRPEVLQPCLECYDLETPNPDCWSCDGRGLVEVYDEEAAKIIVHREMP